MMIGKAMQGPTMQGKLEMVLIPVKEK